MRRLAVARVGALALLVGVAGCGDQSMMTTPDGLHGSPMVLSVTPPGDATGVSTTTTVTIRFSQRMGAGMEQFVDMHRGDLTGPVVPMSCGWSGDRSTLTCSPDAALRAGTRYTIHVGAGMMGANGLPLDLNQMPMGGQWAYSSMMGSHGGMSWNMMGPGWHGSNGSYGMLFMFTTA